MRALVQRVSEASVAIDDEVVASIDLGLVILLAVARSDGEREARRLAEKVAGLRIFDGEDGRMDRSLLDLREQAAALCISQFTLYGDVRRGLRPSFTDAADPEPARALYELFCEGLAERGVRVETGRFGARMSVGLRNEGPVTLMIDL